MKLIISSILITYMNLSSCLSVSGDDNWNTIDAKGFQNKDEHFNKMVFINDTTGFLFGSQWTFEMVKNNTMNKERNAVIYKTIDGGRSWNKTQCGKGIFEDAYYVDGILYAFKNVYYGEQIDHVKSSNIFKSTDQGINWKEVGAIPSKILSFSFYNATTGIAIGHYERNTDSRPTFKTVDGGEHWEKIPQQNTDIRNFVCTKNGVLYFLSTSETEKVSCNILVRKDLVTGEETIEEFPDFRADEIALDSDENIWLLGSSKNSNNKDVIVYKRLSEGKFSAVKVFTSISNKPIFPEGIYIYDKVIYVINSELHSASVTHNLYRSEDIGKNWIEEYLPINYLIAPMALYGKEKVWMNAGGGRIQYREKK